MQVPSHPVSEEHPQVVCVGGFLGAGKTTAIARLGLFLRKMGRTAVVMTAAAGTESVDVLRLTELGLQVEERSEPHAGVVSLVELAGDELIPPGVSASVLVDPLRAAQVLKLDSTGVVPEEVALLYRRQIQQASLLLINRPDSLPSKQLEALRRALACEAPEAQILEFSDEEHSSVQTWWQCLNRKLSRASESAGEDLFATRARHLLAALNCAVRFSTVKYFDGDNLLLELGARIQSVIRHENAELAHLKMFLKPADGVAGFATAHVVSNTVAPGLWESLPEPIQVGRMVLNVRALADPELLHSVVNRALLSIVQKFPELFARLEYSEHFRPDA